MSSSLSLAIGSPSLFSHKRYQLQKERSINQFKEHDFIYRSAEDNLLERLDDIKQDFQDILIIGARSPKPFQRFASAHRCIGLDGFIHSYCATLFDNETYPFPSCTFDLVLSFLTLHWVNDLPGTLSQIRNCLKPDGLFIGVLMGGETLPELSYSLFNAEASLSNTVHSRIGPFVDRSMIGALLQRAGFASPVIDIDRLTAYYPDIFSLMKDIRGMGEANKLVKEPNSLTRNLITQAQNIYAQHFSVDGRLRASFELLYVMGWAPSSSHLKALRTRTRERLLRNVT